MDVDIFINEISTRPALWDNRLKQFSDRDLKSKSWIEVARAVVENSDQLNNEEKNKQVGITDDGESTTNLHETAPPTLNNNNADMEQVTNDASQEAVTAPRAVTSTTRNKTKQSPFEVAVLRHLSESKPLDDEVEGDKNFLLSFLPIMQQLSIEKKLWIRMAITQVMQQAMTCNPQVPCPLPSFQQPNFSQVQHTAPQFTIPQQQTSQLSQYQSQNYNHTPFRPQHNFNICSPSQSGSETSEVYSVIADDDISNLTQMQNFIK
ncbi:hypothetical protein FQR65_LT17876 [Abscondita terminalis]|nr:hypothetical protein FQR65_LT17876 [Abscondita terminalis]